MTDIKTIIDRLADAIDDAGYLPSEINALDDHDSFTLHRNAQKIVDELEAALADLRVATGIMGE